MKKKLEQEWAKKSDLLAQGETFTKDVAKKGDRVAGEAETFGKGSARMVEKYSKDGYAKTLDTNADKFLGKKKRATA